MLEINEEKIREIVAPFQTEAWLKTPIGEKLHAVTEYLICVNERLTRTHNWHRDLLEKIGSRLDLYDKEHNEAYMSKSKLIVYKTITSNDDGFIDNKLVERLFKELDELSEEIL